MTSRPNAPVMVFLHGGAWRGGEARHQAYAAEMFVQAGAHWVVPDFATVMDVGLDGMVEQVRRAVAWVARHAASFGGDPGRLHVGGHSSGAHLAGNVLVTDWVKDFGLHELSPQRHLGRLTAPVVVACAENDSPEFQRQAREFAAVLQQAGRLRQLIVAPGLNHFEIPETLASRDGLLGRAALQLLGLA